LKAAQLVLRRDSVFVLCSGFVEPQTEGDRPLGNLDDPHLAPLVMYPVDHGAIAMPLDPGVDGMKRLEEIASTVLERRHLRIPTSRRQKRGAPSDQVPILSPYAENNVGLYSNSPESQILILNTVVVNYIAIR